MLVSASPPAQLASCETSACLHQRQITKKKDKYKEYQKPPQDDQIVTETFCGT